MIVAGCRKPEPAISPGDAGRRRSDIPVDNCQRAATGVVGHGLRTSTQTHETPTERRRPQTEACAPRHILPYPLNLLSWQPREECRVMSDTNSSRACPIDCLPIYSRGPACPSCQSTPKNPQRGCRRRYVRGRHPRGLRPAARSPEKVLVGLLDARDLGRLGVTLARRGPSVCCSLCSKGSGNVHV